MNIAFGVSMGINAQMDIGNALNVGVTTYGACQVTANHLKYSRQKVKASSVQNVKTSKRYKRSIYLNREFRIRITMNWRVR